MHCQRVPQMKSLCVLFAVTIMAHTAVGAARSSNAWLLQGGRSLRAASKTYDKGFEQIKNIMKRDATSQTLCQNPTFSPSLLNSSMAPCFRPHHPNCTVNFTWTNRGCEATGRCENITLQPDTTNDSTVCWVKARLFPSELTGQFTVGVYAAGANPNNLFVHNYSDPALEAASSLESTIDAFTSADTIILYVVRSLFPHS